jgi:hypothetical protein
MINLRFGSLHQFDTVCMTYPKIARALHVHPSSVFVVVKRFVNNGYRIVDKRKLERKKPIPEKVAPKLLDPALLTNWAPLSLAKRVVLINIKFDVTISRE